MSTFGKLAAPRCCVCCCCSSRINSATPWRPAAICYMIKGSESAPPIARFRHSRQPSLTTPANPNNSLNRTPRGETFNPLNRTSGGETCTPLNRTPGGETMCGKLVSDSPQSPHDAPLGPQVHRNPLEQQSKRPPRPLVVSPKSVAFTSNLQWYVPTFSGYIPHTKRDRDQ